MCNIKKKHQHHTTANTHNKTFASRQTKYEIKTTVDDGTDCCCCPSGGVPAVLRQCCLTRRRVPISGRSGHVDPTHTHTRATSRVYRTDTRVLLSSVELPDGSAPSDITPVCARCKVGADDCGPRDNGSFQGGPKAIWRTEPRSLAARYINVVLRILFRMSRETRGDNDERTNQNQNDDDDGRAIGESGQHSSRASRASAVTRTPRCRTQSRSSSTQFIYLHWCWCVCVRDVFKRQVRD